MPNASPVPGGMKKDWLLHEAAFRRLLAWLDEGVDSGGEKYLEMNRRLMSYFARKGCLAPDDLAHETLTRVARRIEEQGAITDILPARYCYVVAKFVLLEYQRRRERNKVSVQDLANSGAEPDDTRAMREKLLVCLEDCLQKLSPDQRALISAYYSEERREKIERRRELAERLGLTMNAVTIRACRIRDRLESCVRTCSAEK